MRRFLIALVLSVLTTTATASAQTRSSFDVLWGATTPSRFEYRGEGFRNLRALDFRLFASSERTDRRAFWVCGSNTLIVTTDFHSFGSGQYDLEYFRGIEIGSEWITFGYHVEAVPSGFQGPIDISAESAAGFIQWANSLCQRPPATVIEPANVLLGVTEEETYHWVGGRFSRTGDQIRIWAQQDYVREVASQVNVNGVWSDRPTLISDASRGYSLLEYEINCSNRALATRTVVDYDNRGRLVDMRDLSNGTLWTTVPGSVGEGIVETACLIR